MKVEKVMSKIKKDEIVKLLKKIFSSRKKTAGVIIVGLLVVVLGWRVLGNREEKAQFQTAQVERGTIISSVSASGQVLTANITEVTSKASGLVEEVFVSDGDWVETGQKILKITLDQEGKQNQAQAYSSYLSAKNSLESAKVTQYSLQSDMFSKWKTFKDLAESSSYDSPEERTLPQFYIAQDDWLAAEAKYINQQDAIKQAEVAVNNAWLSYQATLSEVSAPVSGTITALSFVEGMRIGAQETTAGTRTSQKVAVIESEGTPIASFNLSEIDVSQVEPEQKATITLDSISDKTFTGKVVSVDRIGTSTSGVTTYPVIIQFDTSSEQILPNMAATANIMIEAKDNVLFVPASAVQKQGEQSFVTVLKEGREQTVAVEAGISSDTQVEIVSGLSEGEVVVSGRTKTDQTTTGGSPFGGAPGMGGMMRMGR